MPLQHLQLQESETLRGGAVWLNVCVKWEGYVQDAAKHCSNVHHLV